MHDRETRSGLWAQALTLDTARYLIFASAQVSWGSVARISRDSQILAVVQSLFTVAGETFKTREVSSMDKPAKKRSSTILLCCTSSLARVFSASSRATKSTVCSGYNAIALSNRTLFLAFRLAAFLRLAYWTRI